MANENLAPESMAPYPYEPTTLDVRNELLDRYKAMHHRAELEAAELRREAMNLRGGVRHLMGALSKCCDERDALEDLVRRARAIIRNRHLVDHPDHKQFLAARSLKIDTKTTYATAHCPTCKVLIAIDGRGA